MESPLVFDVDHDFKATGRYKYIEGGWNTGIEFGRLLPLLAEHPDFPPNKGYITAFDPLTGKTHWMREHSQHWNGGTLSTEAGLVFQGNGDGYFVAYDATNGEEFGRSTPTHLPLRRPSPMPLMASNMLPFKSAPAAPVADRWHGHAGLQ